MYFVGSLGDVVLDLDTHWDQQPALSFTAVEFIAGSGGALFPLPAPHESGRSSGSSGGNVAERTAEPADGANRPGGGHGSAGAMERAFCGDCDPGDCRGTGWHFDQRGAVLDTECLFEVAVSSGRKRIEKQDARRVMMHSSRPVFIC